MLLKEGLYVQLAYFCCGLLRSQYVFISRPTMYKLFHSHYNLRIRYLKLHYIKSYYIL
jgi:hypothetical protein